MAARIEFLARQFENASREFTQTVKSVSDEDWKNLCPAENWTVGVTAHHVAVSYEMAIDVLQALAAGEARPVTTRMLDELNAEHASQHADRTREETVRLLRSNGEEATAAIRGLPEEALDSRHDLPFLGDQPVTLEQLVSICFIGHHDAHLPSIRAAAPSANQATVG
jgi:hypothetical protein